MDSQRGVFYELYFVLLLSSELELLESRSQLYALFLLFEDFNNFAVVVCVCVSVVY